MGYSLTVIELRRGGDMIGEFASIEDAREVALACMLETLKSGVIPRPVELVQDGEVLSTLQFGGGFADGQEFEA